MLFIVLTLAILTFSPTAPKSRLEEPDVEAILTVAVLADVSSSFGDEGGFLDASIFIMAAWGF
jgi:hypothetical protein